MQEERSFYLDLLFLNRVVVSLSPGGLEHFVSAGEECGSRNCLSCHQESCDPPGSGLDPAEERQPNWPLFAYRASSPR
ncbi:uncharacterized [Tachysurus ichikawai]